ncbi:MAG: hypothetical protein LBV17_12745 [Treponema sp.]|jgi:hypothetical protein|nr:hypothetical protein [Treponema sp.]
MSNGYSQFESLVKALEKIIEAVRPMGGYLYSEVGVTVDEAGRNLSPALRLSIAFSEERLTQYIAEAYPQAQCKADK